ncbi:hypothetical protein F5B17DRAFT_408731 [Nemania serpens]|nr:hypothetical protein F5B17DRAFT_408731 [Nemania serpens]
MRTTLPNFPFSLTLSQASSRSDFTENPGRSFQTLARQHILIHNVHLRCTQCRNVEPEHIPTEGTDAIAAGPEPTPYASLDKLIPQPSTRRAYGSPPVHSAIPHARARIPRIRAVQARRYDGKKMPIRKLQANNIKNMSPRKPLAALSSPLTTPRRASGSHVSVLGGYTGRLTSAPPYCPGRQQTRKGQAEKASHRKASCIIRTILSNPAWAMNSR